MQKIPLCLAFCSDEWFSLFKANKGWHPIWTAFAALANCPFYPNSCPFVSHNVKKA